MNVIPLWDTIIGFAVPLLRLAGSAIAYFVKMYQDARVKRCDNFFQLMQFIDGDRGVAAKVAAVYALREFKEHQEFVIRFCDTQRHNITGPNATSLMDELSLTSDAMQAR